MTVSSLKFLSYEDGYELSVREIKIEVVSRLEAGEILCTPDQCAEITYLVSIGDGEDPLPEGYENAERKVRFTDC